MALTRRGKVIVGLGVVAFFLGCLLLIAYLYGRSIGVFGSSDLGEPVSLRIPQGATAEEIGTILERNDVIRSALGFRIALYLEGGFEDIQAGRYELFEGMVARDAIEALTQGALADEFVTVTFPEGSWLTDFARILQRNTHISGAEFLELVETGTVRSRYSPTGIDTQEGLLFPSTYQIIERDDARSVAERVIGEFDRRLDALDFSGVEAFGISPYEAIIVASMIEAEAKVGEERVMIARVIYNRLDQGIALGIDATVNYALGEHKEVLTQSDLAVDSPYNTRLYPGLPPTPIGAPGEASLQAAVAPAAGDWLYYVLEDCDGHHAFSESYDEFLRNKARYQALDCS